MELSLILGPVVISALITGFASLYTSRKNNHLQYMINEEKERCKILREIIKKLNKSDYNETLNVLLELKSYINVFGITEKNKNYLDDTHIWEVIKQIEKLGPEPNEEVLKKQKELLINYLLLLIGYTEKKAKENVRGDVHVIMSGVVCVAACLYGGISCILFMQDNEIGTRQGISVIILFISLLLLITGTVFSSVLSFYYTWKKGEWKVSKRNFILTWSVIFVVYIILYFQITAILQSIEVLTFLLLYFISGACYFSSDAKKIIRIQEYQKAIESFEVESS